MITEEFIAVFQKSLELKKRQIENYENLLNYKAGANLVGKVVAEEGTKLKVLKKILSEIREEMNTRENPQLIGLKINLDRTMSQLEQAWLKLEKQLGIRPEKQPEKPPVKRPETPPEKQPKKQG